MVKNTFLGMAVFETYGIVVERMAPVQKETASATVITTTAVNSKDPYARASVVVHCLAGALGGIAHGLVGTAWDAIAQWNVRANIKGPLNNNTTAANTANTPLAVLLSGAPRMIAHHTVAHAALFGSYEGIKRVLVSRMNDRMGHITTNLEVSDGAPFHDGSALPRKEPMTRVEYLGCVAIAGGLAGQVQHVVSSYSEQLLSMTTIPKWSNLILLKPLLLAFAPSSIAFVALEYGRRES